MIPDSLSGRLPQDTLRTWAEIVDLIPKGAYLAGGTAVALHLGHRESRDLDWFCREAVDVSALHERLTARGPWVATEVVAADEGFTLNGVYSATRVQFLDARPLHLTEPLTRVAGAEVAGLGDLLAMKLKVIVDRGELRDYYDIHMIEVDGGRPIEEGLGLLLEVYRPPDPDGMLRRAFLALGHFGDVEEDPGIPMPKDELERWFRGRLPRIAEHLGVS